MFGNGTCNPRAGTRGRTFLEIIAAHIPALVPYAEKGAAAILAELE
jgi:hypothetical protein